MCRSVVGRIATVVVVVGIGVVVWIHRGHVVMRSSWRRHRRTVAVVVVAVVTGTVVVARTRRHVDDHPRLGVTTVPAEAYRLEVFEHGEAEQLIVEFVVWHHRVDP